MKVVAVFQLISAWPDLKRVNQTQSLVPEQIHKPTRGNIFDTISATGVLH